MDASSVMLENALRQINQKVLCKWFYVSSVPLQDHCKLTTLGQNEKITLFSGQCLWLNPLFI